MTEVCWDGALGPINANAGNRCWTALDRDGRDVLPERCIYINDQTGELWALGARGGQPFTVNGEVLVLRTRLGAGAFRLVPKE